MKTFSLALILTSIIVADVHAQGGPADLPVPAPPVEDGFNEAPSLYTDTLQESSSPYISSSSDLNAQYFPQPHCPETSAAMCPPASFGAALAPMPVQNVLVRGVPTYPYYIAPIPFSKISHIVRKRAFLNISPGNMLPPQPIYPVANGSYYYRPYAFNDVSAQQMQASYMGMRPSFPYTPTPELTGPVPARASTGPSQYFESR